MKKTVFYLFATILIMVSTLTAAAVTPVKKPMPNVAEENMLISVPGRFYYFDDDDNLHCYNKNTSEDTQIEYFNRFNGFGGVSDAWYESNSDCVYFIEWSRGLEFESVTVYKLPQNNNPMAMLEVDGIVGDVDYKVADAYVYFKGYVNEESDVNIPGVRKGEKLNKKFTKDLKPLTSTK